MLGKFKSFVLLIAGDQELKPTEPLERAALIAAAAVLVLAGEVFDCKVTMQSLEASLNERLSSRTRRG